MKKTLTALFILSLVAFSTELNAQRIQASPKVTITQVVGNTEMKLEYSRPSLDGRDVNTLVNDPNENGPVWRTGANNNTLISFNKDVTLGGKAVKAGTYSLWTIPSNGEWTIILNSITDKWGTQYDKSGDVVQFKAPVTKTSGSVETFEIHMTDFDKNAKDKANIELVWGNLSVKFPIEVKN